MRLEVSKILILIIYKFNYKFLGTTKFDEARKKREEKKLQRQRELEARRAARSGPMKLGLGAKKL
jgi:hypothetical protein